MTHADLVARAVRWLRGTQRCTVVLAELVTLGPEIPDAIGWVGWNSILVECKVSRADFRRDRDKPHMRLPDGGMGRQRWYLTPPGLIGVDDLPDGWGLAEALARSVRVVRAPIARPDWRRDREIGLLTSAVRRHDLGVPFDTVLARFMPLTDPRHPRWRTT